MAIANPIIANYKPFYIQFGNGNAKDTLQEWGFIAKTNPFPALPNPKDPYKNEWLDENGDEEFVAQMRYQSFEFTVDFYIRAQTTVVLGAVTETAESVVRTSMSNFFNAVKNGDFKIYDSYTGLGRQNVRYAGFEEDKFVSRRVDGADRSQDWAMCIFKIKFKVNDPVKFCKLVNGQIVAI